ncbi:MAG: metal ABC transporter solute-binding protein, Zn/Mn family [Solirubrobacteraceae bacterium]
MSPSAAVVRRPRRPRRIAAGAVLTAVLALAAAGCASTQATTAGSRVRVVAAENFWGSIARQIGGTRASVSSLIVNPAVDPHAYEPTTADARAMATAQLAIVNGIGYDPWAPKLLAANPVSGRVTLNVGDIFGLKEGDNPHRWYDPGDLPVVAEAIGADLAKLDPADKAYFAQRVNRFETQGLAAYHHLIARIHDRYIGTPVGASESIFAPLAPELGLNLLTPQSFMRAVSEGTEVTAQDTITAERQITSHRIKLWVYNAQNVTPEIKRLNGLAAAAHIPIVTVTETLSPSTDSLQQWQVAQLQRVESALRQATGR